MLTVVVAALAVLGLSGFIYLSREQMGLEGAALATLRTVALAALVLLLVNPVSSRLQPGGSPVVLLDASLSMAVPGGKWEGALDTATVLAGARGTILRFGDAVSPFDDGPPSCGASRLFEALRTAVGHSGPIYVVTDGELDDAGVLHQQLLNDVTFVTLPRDTVNDVALLAVEAPDRILRNDSVPITYTVGVWGRDYLPSVDIEIWIGDRRLISSQVDLPVAPGVARRRLTLPAGMLPNGTNVLQCRLRARNDLVPGDDERILLITVADGPAVIALLDPLDWEGRFLVGELNSITNTTVLAYAHVGSNRWIDVATGYPASRETVVEAAEGAELLLSRGAPSIAAGSSRLRASWNWPTVPSASSAEGEGEWYLSRRVPASPLGGRLTSVQWDSVPPVVGLGTQGVESRGWIGLTAQRGRRGAQRPVLLGNDSAGARSLMTLGTGWWRWRLKGGAAREAYRSVLAAGVDWLLSAVPRGDAATLVSSDVVERGEPLLFRWVGSSVPDSMTVSLARDGTDSVETRVARFGPDGMAQLSLYPGVYRWHAVDAGDARGITVVEEYSDEYHPRHVAGLFGGAAEGETLVERYARDRWWLFLIVVIVLTAEWAWRHQRGLP